MKIHQIISENRDLEEAPVGMFQKAGQSIGRYLGFDSAAGAEEVSNEANQLKKQLSRWMGRQGIKSGTLTFDDLEEFLGMVGYGGLAAAELEKAKSQKSLGQKAGAKLKAVGAGVKGAAQGAVAGARSGYQSVSQESINENSEALSNAVVDRILLAVVQKASRKGSDVKKGKFVKPTKPAADLNTDAQKPGVVNKTAAAPAASGAKRKAKPPMFKSIRGNNQTSSSSTGSQQKPKFPADVVNSVSKLTPDQRRQLAQLLQR